MAALVTVIGLVVLVFGAENSVAYDFGGILSAIIAGGAYALYTECASLTVLDGAHPSATLAAMFLTAGVISSPLLIFHRLSWLTTTRGIVVILYLSLITLTVAYIAFGRALLSLNPMTVVMLTTFEPVVASVLAVCLLDENLTLAAWVGAVFVLVGLIMVGISKPQQTTVRR